MKLTTAIRRWYYGRKIRAASKILAYLDEYMIAAGYSRTKRRQFWRGYIKSAEARKSIIDSLIK